MILQRPVRKFLYKYRSNNCPYMEEEILRAITLKEIFFSTLANLNDPFEGNPTETKVSPKGIRELLRIFYSFPECKGLTITGMPVVQVAREKGFPISKAKEIASSSLAFARLIQNSYGKERRNWRKNTAAYCLSEHGDSVLMWSHYSNSHKGYCLEWIFSRSRNYGDSPTPTEVEYVNSRSTLSVLDLVNLMAWKKFRDGRISDKERAISTTRSLACEKADDWEYEGEWRFLDFIQDGDGYRAVKGLELSRVIMGTNSSQALHEKIARIVDGQIPIVCVEIDASSYSVNIPKQA